MVERSSEQVLIPLRVTVLLSGSPIVQHDPLIIRRFQVHNGPKEER